MFRKRRYKKENKNIYYEIAGSIDEAADEIARELKTDSMDYNRRTGKQLPSRSKRLTEIKTYKEVAELVREWGYM